MVWLSVSVAMGQQMLFQQITTADGLSDNAITKLYQARDGFLWVGTEGGLNRYDGHHVRVWHAQDGLGGEQVTDIVQDRHGQVWVATAEGALARLAADGGTISFARIGSDAVQERIGLRLNCLFDLDDTTLMIGAQAVPIIFYDKRTGRCTYWAGQGPIAPAVAVAQPVVTGDWCHYIADLGDGHLLSGFLRAFEQRLLDRATGRVVGQAFHLIGPGDQTVVAAFRMHDRLYGVGWQPRLHVHDLHSGADIVWPLPDEGVALVQEDSLHLLVATAASGLLRVDLRDGSYQAFRHRPGEPRSLGDDRVRALLRDREARTWVGTANGLYLHAPRQWWTQRVPLGDGAENELLATIVYGIGELPDGTLAICTNDGLFMGKAEGPMRRIVVHADGRALRPTALLAGSGGYWLGAEEGLYRWQPGSALATEVPWSIASTGPHVAGSTSYARMPGLFQVRDLYADTVRGRPFLVVGVRGYGVALLDRERHQAELLLNDPARMTSLGNNLVARLVRDGAGDYWVGTSHGLYQWKVDRSAPDGRFRSFLKEDGQHPLPSNDVLDLLPDARGVLWIAMRNGGLASWDGVRMRTFPLPGSLGNTVKGLAMDQTGRVWCAMRGGFAVMDTTSAAWQVLPVAGMRGTPVMPAGTRSLRDGRIVFVADNMLQSIVPAAVPETTTPPRPYLTQLEVHGGAMHGTSGERLTLRANAGPLRVAVSALDLAPEAPYRYLFQLEGIDPEPRMADAAGNLVYASLPPGEYRLVARTLASDGRLSPPVVLARIAKAAPLWQRWWFYLVMVVAAAALAYVVSRYRYRERLRLQQVRIRIASDLHDEVGSSLSAIHIGSQLAASLSNQEEGQVKEILARLGQTSTASLRSIRDIVWAIDPGHDEGEALVDRMRRITRELLGDKGVDVSFVVTGGVEQLKLPMGARKELLLLFKEALHNCSNYAEADTVQVSLHRQGRRLRLSIKDDGAGFDPRLHPDGQGLASMARRAKALGTELQLSTAPGMGTLVAVELDLTDIRD